MYAEILKFTSDHQVTLVAVSKTKPVEDILVLYQAGQRVFGENKVQELVSKAELLPKDINWHMIGHLQTNKVKYIAPFVSMIQSVDSEALLRVIDAQGAKNKRIIPVLLQFHIAEEETKFGFDAHEAKVMMQQLKKSPLNNIKICGVMGMASFTDDQQKVRQEFQLLKQIFDDLKKAYFSDSHDFREISMGMSGDYKLAIAEGSTMVRIGSAIFGSR
jgi:pyridoxal phosphate enzyme (YggS family)